MTHRDYSGNRHPAAVKRRYLFADLDNQNKFWRGNRHPAAATRVWPAAWECVFYNMRCTALPPGFAQLSRSKEETRPMPYRNPAPARTPLSATICVLALAACAVPEQQTPAPAVAAPLAAEDYLAAAALLEGNVVGLVKNMDVEPHWLGDSGRFWYRRDTDHGHEFVVFDPSTGEKTRAFDHGALAQAINASLAPETLLEADRLALDAITIADDLSTLEASVPTASESPRVRCTLQPVGCAAAQPVEPAPRDWLISPDGRLALFAREHNLYLKDLERGAEHQLTSDGAPWISWGKWPDTSLITIPRKKMDWPLPPYMTAWSPDSRYLIAPRIDEREVAAMPFVEWVPADGSRRPVVHNLRMPIVGDAGEMRMDFFAIDAASGTSVRIELPAGHGVNSLLNAGVLGWSEERSQAFMVVTTTDAQSGGLIRVDLASGKTSTVIRETSATRVETNPDVQPPQHPPARRRRRGDLVRRPRRLGAPVPARCADRSAEGYVVQRTWDYFVRNLLGVAPPRDVQVANGAAPRR